MDLLFFFVSVQKLGFFICPYHNGKLFILCWVYAHTYKNNNMVGPNNILNNYLDWMHWMLFNYLTPRLVLLFNNPQNNEMKFCENMKLTCWNFS